MDIIVKSQKELDAVPVDTKDTIIIEFGTDESPAIITKRYVHPVEVHGNYVVTAYYSWIKACDNSTVETYGNSYIHAFGNSLVVTYDNSTVWAHESSSVWANDNSIVVVWKIKNKRSCLKMKNDEFMKNELARAEKEIKLWKERSKSWNKKVRDLIGDAALSMYKYVNETGEFRFLIKDQLMYLVNSLFDVKPLTPLTEDEDEWDDISKNFGTESKFGYKKYQNKRYPELFKNVYSCGKTEYHDNNRVTCYDPIMDTTFDLGLINKIYDEIFPIKMPYMPGESNAYINVFCFQSDQKNADKSDFDTVVVMDSETEHEEHDDLNVINRFFREPKENESPTYGGWVEIDIFELKERIDASAMKNLDLSDLGLDDVYKEACAKKGIED